MKKKNQFLLTLLDINITMFGDFEWFLFIFDFA